MNRRMREPLIWPPNRNETSKLMSSAWSALPSVAWMERIADPIRCAALNIVGAFISVSSSLVSGFSTPSLSVEITDWLIANPGVRADYLAAKRTAESAGHRDAGAYADAKEPWFLDAYRRAWDWASATGWAAGR